MSYPIVVCIDRHYLSAALVLISSLLRSSSESISLYLVSQGLDRAEKLQLTTLIGLLNKHRAQPAVLEFVDADIDALLKEQELNPPLYHHSLTPYLKLFLPEILEEKGLDRILYLDADIICKGDIKELFAFKPEVSEAISADKGLPPIMAAIDKRAFEQNYPQLTPTYFNTGVMLLSLVYLRDSNFAARAAQFIQFNQDNLLQPVDDIFSNVIDEVDFVPLPERFNEFGVNTHAVEQALLLHYAGFRKPWEHRLRWRLKKVYWLTERIYMRALLKGLRLSPFTLKLLFHVLSLLRPLMNLQKAAVEMIIGKKVDE